MRIIAQRIKRLPKTTKGPILILLERSTIDSCCFWLTKEGGREISSFKRKHFNFMYSVHIKIIQLFQNVSNVTINYYCHINGNQPGSIMPVRNILYRYRHNEFNIFITPTLDTIVDFYHTRHRTVNNEPKNITFGLDTILRYLPSAYINNYKFRSPSIPPANMYVKECVDAIFKSNDMNIVTLGPEVWNDNKLSVSDCAEIYLRPFDVFNDFFIDAHSQKMAQEKMARADNIRSTPRCKRAKQYRKITSHR